MSAPSSAALSALRLTRALAATGTQTRAAAVIEEMRAAVAANNIPCVDRGELRAALVALDMRFCMAGDCAVRWAEN